MALRVLIIDGNPAVGRGLKALLDEMSDLVVVGVANCPVRGLCRAVTTSPDVALVDAEMPGLASAAAIRLLRARSPRTRIIALGIYPARRSAALGAGADAFLLKDAGFAALRAAIHGQEAPQQSTPTPRQISEQPDRSKGETTAAR